MGDMDWDEYYQKGEVFWDRGAPVALLVVVYRTVARCCGRKPGWRRWFLLAGAVTLCLAGRLVPWVFAKLEPPFSESPVGLFIILGKILVVGSLLLVAVGTLLGAALPSRRRVSPAPHLFQSVGAPRK